MGEEICWVCEGDGWVYVDDGVGCVDREVCGCQN